MLSVLRKIEEQSLMAFPSLAAILTGFKDVGARLSG